MNNWSNAEETKTIIKDLERRMLSKNIKMNEIISFRNSNGFKESTKQALDEEIQRIQEVREDLKSLLKHQKAKLLIMSHE